MDRVALTDFMTSIAARFSPRPPGPTAGSATSSVTSNEVAHEARHTILVEIISRSINPLNVLLLTLAAVSYLLGDQRAAIVIAIMVLLSVSLGFFEEHRSTKAADALRRMVQTKATVRRQDRGPGHGDVAIGQVVPGDIVLLSAGDMIPADIRL